MRYLSMIQGWVYERLCFYMNRYIVDEIRRSGHQGLSLMLGKEKPLAGEGLGRLFFRFVGDFFFYYR